MFDRNGLSENPLAKQGLTNLLSKNVVMFLLIKCATLDTKQVTYRLILDILY